MSIDLVSFEHQVLDFWRQKNIFDKSQKKNSGSETFVFYDGPPFATGTPHHGHLTASTIKDVIGRFWSMQGKNVPRRWGWDCHGLPIENEIHKKLEMSAEKAVAELGVAGYNKECRGIVQRYTSEWQETIERLGRWVDFDNCYKTMDSEYMESVWWVFKQLWDKGLVYQGTKVMPFSTALGTPLSNFEAGSNYQDVQDPSVTVLFEKCFDVGNGPCWPTYFAAWTTTPWTLPANLALAVNPEVTYVEFLVNLGKGPIPDYAHTSVGKEGEYLLIMAKDCLESYPELKIKKWNILKEYKGSELVGQHYGDLSMVTSDGNLWPTWDKENSHQILAADFVRTDTGTGIVHCAPAFGEDDYRVCKAAEIDPICPVDESGKFTDEVHAYAGLHVKEADKKIIGDLKKAGHLLQRRTINHSYPHCPRTDTPLIYKLVPCWYIAVEKIKDKLLAANAKTSWVPEHIKDGRFGSWLENARDWCVSRNRIWGTPLPIWVNDKTGKSICIGSIEELVSYASPHLADVPISKAPDLHREFIDPITFSVDGEEGVYRRIPEVFDCWFESGSMPYAQMHYPFENGENFESSFPADFIAEGQDQTRGWFYTLTVLSAALYDEPAFKNVIVNGIVLAADGKKMAKRLKNYTDPMILLDKYGADALRLYFLNSGLTRAEDLKFVDEDIRACIKSLLLPWYNATKFFTTYAAIDGWNQSHNKAAPENLLDLWLLGECDELLQFVNQELKAYRLYNVVPRIVQFMDSLTNTYVRLNRRRFWASGLSEDKCQGYGAYFQVLKNLVSALAPLVPFMAEHLYQELQPFGKSISKAGIETTWGLGEESVHLLPYPQSGKKVNTELLRSVRLMQQVILLGRRKREEKKIEIKIPLGELKIIHKDGSILSDIQELENYIKAELNVKTISYCQDEDTYIEIYAKPNFKRLGKRLGTRMRNFKKMIEALSRHALEVLEEQNCLVLAEETFNSEDIQVFRRAKEGTATVSNRAIGIELDCQLTPALLREGLARKIVSCLQNFRKDSGLELTDRIKVQYWVGSADSEISLAIEGHKPYIMEETLSVKMVADDKARKGTLFALDNEKLFLKIAKI